MIFEIKQWTLEVRHWFGHDWLYWEHGQFDLPYGQECRTCRYCGVTQVHRDGQWRNVNGSCGK